MEIEMSIVLDLSKNDYDRMLQHCIDGLPNEACGLLAGTVEGEKKTIKKVYLLTNIDESREHFSMDPKEQLAAVKDARANGWVLIGNFHSHPESPSRPSEEDKRLAYDSSIEYLILSLMERENPVLKAFGIDNEKNVTIHEIKITG
jgi:proteasome lid subunit RPN8/RPN11